MANPRSNYPLAQTESLNGTIFAQETVASLAELSGLGRPQNVQELRVRIENFFAFCEASSIRPGVETLCAALGISRMAFWKWCQGSKGAEWQEACLAARQHILAFIEQASLSGKLNPATSIFMLKNWAGYADAPRDLNPDEKSERALDAAAWRRKFALAAGAEVVDIAEPLLPTEQAE